MMVKPLTLLVAMALCCCLAAADAFSGCHCLGAVKKPVPYRAIKKIEMLPISGHCRRPETILTRKNGFKMCIDPNQKWFKVLLSQIRRSVETAGTTATPASV